MTFWPPLLLERTNFSWRSCSRMPKRCIFSLNSLEMFFCLLVILSLGIGYTVLYLQGQSPWLVMYTSGSVPLVSNWVRYLRGQTLRAGTDPAALKVLRFTQDESLEVNSRGFRQTPWFLLFADYLYQNALFTLTIKFSVEYLFPRTKIKFAISNRHYYLSTHYCSF